MISLCLFFFSISILISDIDMEEYLGFIGLVLFVEMLVVFLFLIFRGVLILEGLGSKRFGIFSFCFFFVVGSSFFFLKKFFWDRVLERLLVGFFLDLE